MTIITKRTFLRQFVLEDVEDFYEYCKNPNIGKGGGWKPHQNIDESQQIINNFVIDEGEVAIVYKSRVIGSFGLHPDKMRNFGSAYMIGYCLSEDFWGMGLMTEVAQAVINYAFTEKGATIVSVYHFPFNERSKRVIEKCGFVYEGTIRRSYQMYDGEVFDEMCYSLLKEEWESSLKVELK